MTDSTTKSTGRLRRAVMATALIAAGAATVGAAATPAEAQYYPYPYYASYPYYTPYYYNPYPSYYGPAFRVGWGWGGWHGGWGGGWHSGWGWHAGWGWRGGWGWHRGWGWRAGRGWPGGWGWRHAWWGGCGCAYYPFVVTYDHRAPAPIAGDRFTVYFASAKSDLSNDAKATIDNAIADAQRGAQARIAILGHTDRVGRGDSNLRLSEQRAETVAEYMVAHGVPRDAIQIRAYGESANSVPTPNGVSEPKNRRVEIIVTPGRGAPVAGGPPQNPATPMNTPNGDDATRTIRPPPAPETPPPANAPPTNLVKPDAT